MQIKQFLKRAAPGSLVGFFKKLRYNQPGIIYNIGLTAGVHAKVLVVYVNRFLFVEDLSLCHGTRDIECASMISSLVQLGCRVDLARHDCKKGIRNDYDYIIGQGDAYRLASDLNPKAKRVLYLTENPPSLSLKKESERIAYFEKRHNIRLTTQRSGRFFKEEDFKHLQACIFIGNPSAADKLPHIKTYTIRPTGLLNPLFKITNRDFEKARKRFLWIGSSGAVHKGLDLLLDVFASHQELELYIIGLCEYERRMLKRFMGPNVKNFGYINIRSEMFSKLASECAFVVLPSCSEGLATSVITGMNHGLIPLVTRETSIEAPVGEVFSDFTINIIEETIVRWSKMPVDYLFSESEKTYQFSLETYTIENYSSRIKEIFRNIIINNRG